jgi:two-component system response regulator CpxR
MQTRNSEPLTNGREQGQTMRPRKTILCVDDNEQILSVRKFLLETRGYRVIAVNTGQEALEQLRQAPLGSIDLLVCDLLLQNADGNEVVRRAKQLHPMLPALLVSGTVTSFERASAADAFLPKGICTPAEMLERIRVLVTRKRGPRKHVPVPVDDVAIAS